MLTQSDTLYPAKKPHQDKISRLLLELGLSPAMLGFSMTRDVLTAYLENKTQIGILYGEVAKRYCVSPMSVERNIRASLEVAANGGHFSRINKLCKSELVRNGEKLSNKEFIATAAMLLQLDMFR